jgi:glutamate N-acetyltransferase / amino-acid N-acetyltransferase
MRDAVRRAVSELDSGGGRRAAMAILTSDPRPKDRAVVVSLRDSRNVVIGGMAKGSRIVHPRQSTVLGILTTDLVIDTRLLARSLEQSVAQSFGRLTIEGDASPNDSVILLANGAAENRPITDAGSWEYGAWQEALDAICADLAQQVLRDAAGNGKIIQVQVRGASSPSAAHQVALAVARSAPVRWACAQGVADWGGLLVAVGASGVDLRPDVLELRLGPVTVMADGMPARFDTAAAVQALSGPEIELMVDLHIGSHGATICTCASD